MTVYTPDNAILAVVRNKWNINNLSTVFDHGCSNVSARGDKSTGDSKGYIEGFLCTIDFFLLLKIRGIHISKEIYMRSNEKMGQDEFYEILYDSNPIETSDIYPVLSLVA